MRAVKATLPSESQTGSLNAVKVAVAPTSETGAELPFRTITTGGNPARMATSSPAAVARFASTATASLSAIEGTPNVVITVVSGSPLTVPPVERISVTAG